MAYVSQDSAAYSLDTQLPLSRVALAPPPQQPCRLPLSSRPRQPYIFYNAPTVSSWMLSYSICSPHQLKPIQSKRKRPQTFLPHLPKNKYLTSTYAKYRNPTTSLHLYMTAALNSLLQKPSTHLPIATELMDGTLNASQSRFY